MEFTQITINGLFDSTVQYRIPIYQRAYSWDKEQWKVFLNDLLQHKDSSNVYSYGNLMLEIIEKDKIYDIIDGQQRLTTIVIFMRALHNTLEKKGESKDELDYIKEKFFQRRGTKKLRPIENDQACFDSVIIEDESFGMPSSSSQERIVNAKKFFEDELSKYDIEVLRKLKDTVNGSDINKIWLHGKKEAALMFELQNNRGIALTNMEKLKSFFLYQIYLHSEESYTEANIENVVNDFNEIYKIVHDLKDIDEDSVLLYHCYAYLNASFGYRNLDHLKGEYEKSPKPIEWINNFAKQLAISFKDLKRFQAYQSVYKDRIIRLSNGQRLPPYVYPFIIKGYKYFDNDNTKLDKLLSLLEVVSFRQHLLSSRADLNSRLIEPLRIFDGNLEVLRDAIMKKFNEEWHWCDQRVKDTLIGPMYGNPALHYLLWEYEDYLQVKGYSVTGDIDEEQIEHISPQTPSGGGEPIASGYDVDQNNQYSEAFTEKYLNCVGNLMLISASHNSSIGNKPFKEKLESYAKPPLRQMAQILSIVGDKEEWKTEQIIERQKQIVDGFAINRWSFDAIKL